MASANYETKCSLCCSKYINASIKVPVPLTCCHQTVCQQCSQVLKICPLCSASIVPVDSKPCVMLKKLRQSHCLQCPKVTTVSRSSSTTYASCNTALCTTCHIDQHVKSLILRYSNLTCFVKKMTLNETALNQVMQSVQAIGKQIYDEYVRLITPGEVQVNLVPTSQLSVNSSLSINDISEQYKVLHKTEDSFANACGLLLQKLSLTYIGLEQFWSNWQHTMPNSILHPIDYTKYKVVWQTELLPRSEFTKGCRFLTLSRATIDGNYLLYFYNFMSKKIFSFNPYNFTLHCCVENLEHQPNCIRSVPGQPNLLMICNDSGEIITYGKVVDYGMLEDNCKDKPLKFLKSKKTPCNSSIFSMYYENDYLTVGNSKAGSLWCCTNSKVYQVNLFTQNWTLVHDCGQQDNEGRIYSHSDISDFIEQVTSNASSKVALLNNSQSRQYTNNDDTSMICTSYESSINVNSTKTVIEDDSDAEKKYIFDILVTLEEIFLLRKTFITILDRNRITAANITNSQFENIKIKLHPVKKMIGSFTSAYQFQMDNHGNFMVSDLTRPGIIVIDADGNLIKDIVVSHNCYLAGIECNIKHRLVYVLMHATTVERRHLQSVCIQGCNDKCFLICLAFNT